MELCVALDLPSAKENLALAESLKAHDIWMKVGFRAYIRDGKDFIKALKAINPNFKISSRPVKSMYSLSSVA